MAQVKKTSSPPKKVQRRATRVRTVKPKGTRKKSNTTKAKKTTANKFTLTKDDVKYWTKKLNVSDKAIRTALNGTGSNNPAVVKKYLIKNGYKK